MHAREAGRRARKMGKPAHFVRMIFFRVGLIGGGRVRFMLIFYSVIGVVLVVVVVSDMVILVMMTGVGAGSESGSATGGL